MGSEEPWSRLEGKVVMVTGASSGIGRDLCVDLAKAGCLIVASARRTDLLRSLCEEVRALTVEEPGRIAAVRLDISQDGDTIDAAVQAAWEVFGRIDVLVNNAGVRGTVSMSLELREQEWVDTMDTNLKGTWLVSRSFCRLICDAKLKGSVVNISSIGGLNRGLLPGGLAYGASKAGVNFMTKMMALELGSYSIRVNSIAPGLFKSAITAELMKKEWLTTVAERINPLRTFGTADPALTSLVRYLIHDDSDYVTGNVFIVDVGATLPGIPIYSSL
ncbi:unnamed protein product [Victoria cruziana]